MFTSTLTVVFMVTVPHFFLSSMFLTLFRHAAIQFITNAIDIHTLHLCEAVLEICRADEDLIN